MDETEFTITFNSGTLELRGAPGGFSRLFPQAVNDPRARCLRCAAIHYRSLVSLLHKNGIAHADLARKYDKLEFPKAFGREPFPHQAQSVDAWWKAGGRGVVVLPTGTGKTFTAILAISRAGRSTLVVAPTLELVSQWRVELERLLETEVGTVGGGERDWKPVTAITYDSAHLLIDRWGPRYGMVVFDEAHHLPGAAYRQSATGSIAPFRLAITATPERTDGGEHLLNSLVGPLVYRREISELAGEYLAEYVTKRIWVELNPVERERHDKARETYRDFVTSRGIDTGSPSGWRDFITAAAREPEGREAFKAYREQRRIVQRAEAKLQKLEELMRQHAGERMLVFTSDNATVYDISRRFLVPALTHRTRPAERREWLRAFHSGELPVIATSRVLNEGVDVPAASIGVVLSGSGTPREHVQRLGRILRRSGDKQARLFELVVRDSGEAAVSKRRRDHDAYR
jgi:superfamily II DNA or RNA helicase